jgi:hypothetical protein
MQLFSNNFAAAFTQFHHLCFCLLLSRIQRQCNGVCYKLKFCLRLRIFGVAQRRRYKALPSQWLCIFASEKPRSTSSNSDQLHPSPSFLVPLPMISCSTFLDHRPSPLWMFFRKHAFLRKLSAKTLSCGRRGMHRLPPAAPSSAQPFALPLFITCKLRLELVCILLGFMGWA